MAAWQLRADIEARDTTWVSTPLVRAQFGTGLPHVDNPVLDWTATIRALIEAGASTADITLSPDDLKPPSPEVAELLRGYDIGPTCVEAGNRKPRSPLPAHPWPGQMSAICCRQRRGQGGVDRPPEAGQSSAHRRQGRARG